MQLEHFKGKARILEQYDLRDITFNSIIEYYLLEDIKNNEVRYGIRLTKWFNYFYCETKTIPFVTNNELLIADIIEKLINGKVTPICLEDIISDYLDLTNSN